MATPTTASSTVNNFEFAALNEARNYRAALMQEFSAFLRGRVMEVGAGIGQITKVINQQPGVTSMLAVEPDERFSADFRSALPAVPLVVGTVKDVDPASHWDAIVCVNVLEHIEADEAELRSYHQFLARDRGHLCLFVPARPEIYAPIDKDFGHFRRYTRPELDHKLRKAGFQVVKLTYFNFVGYFAWWLTFCVLKKRVFDIHAVRFYDRVIFPAAFACESRILRPPFGQSLLAVAQAV